jgi:hypothetical protein
MERKKVVKIFTRFLKEKNAFYAFRRNFDTYFYCPSQPPVTCRQYLDKVPNSNYIQYAFHWMDMPEGYDFWNNIDKDWRKIVRAEKLWKTMK